MKPLKMVSLFVAFAFAVGCSDSEQKEPSPPNPSPVSGSNPPADSSADKGQSYLEVKDEKGVHKVFTKDTGSFSVVVILDEKNAPDAIALLDWKKGNAVVEEFRNDEKATSPGLLLLDASLTDSSSSSNAKLTEWRKKYAVFKVSKEGKNKGLLAKKSAMKPFKVYTHNGGIVVDLPINDCSCDVIKTPTCCIQSGCACFYRHFCNSVNCVWLGDVACVQQEIQTAFACMGIVVELKEEQKKDARAITLKDLVAERVDGKFDLTY